jgi:hypothetical protein
MAKTSAGKTSALLTETAYAANVCRIFGRPGKESDRVGLDTNLWEHLTFLLSCLNEKAAFGEAAFLTNFYVR